MKYLIILFAFLFSLVAVKAESKEETMKLLAKKLEFQSPDYDLVDKETMVLRNEFMNKHKKLFDSLGKKEIFYHLELTYSLFDEDRPGLQPHAVYAAHLYSKFYNDYTDEEKKIISERILGFAEQGWLRKEDLEPILAAQSKEDLKKPIATVGNKILFIEPAEASPNSTKTLKMEEVTPLESPIKIPAEDSTDEPYPAPAKPSSNWHDWLADRWLWLLVVAVGVIGLAWAFKRK